MRGLKFSFYEGGIRVPMIARWPGRVAAGTTTDCVSAFWDVPATFAELAGTTWSGGDGVSLVPTLLGRPQEQRQHDYLYWELTDSQAVRRGDWKGTRRGTKPLELYHLADDLTEQHDVAAEHPDVVAEIMHDMKEAHVDSPEFPLGAKAAKKK